MEATKVMFVLLAGLISVKLQETWNKQDWIANVQCVPHYHFMGELENISVSFTPLGDPASSYDITFSDSTTGTVCDQNAILMSSCDNGTKKCTDQFHVPNSQCSSLTSINVTISTTVSGKWLTSKPTKIDSVNKFVRVSFDKEHYSIRCTFLKESKTSKKSCIVKYGQASTQGCNALSFHTEGYLLNSKSISLQLDLTSKICFVVIASEGNDTVNVEGTFAIDAITTATDPSAMYSVLHSPNSIWPAIGTLSIVIACICFLLFLIRTVTKSPEDNNSHGALSQKTTEELPEKDQLPTIIDESTTAYRLWVVNKKCLMYEFAKEHHPGYQPQDGLGYFQVGKNLIIQDHKKVILMDEVKEKVPRYIVYPATIKQQIIEGRKQVYAQDRSFTRMLDPGSKFLFCARSKAVAAYTRLYDVTKECKQSEFTLENIPGYSTDWMQYCYFELTKPEYIQPHQHVLVMKMDGKLWLGPGIRHLVGTGDGSKLTQKPDLSRFSEWKHVFVQSMDFNRNLIPGTKYLFCVKMDRVRAHYNIFIVEEQCKMAEFGRRHIPGYKAEYGYGYYEFTEDEYFKPHKKVILVRQDKKLYTGGGAQFVCADGRYDKEIIERQRKITPPSLIGTEWKHIFIQSHSKDRELLPGTRFLYCEYKTYK